jgi:hypothetical protein
MTSRQHSGTKLYKDGENSLGDGNTMLRGRGPVWADWFMRWLRCADTIQTADGIAATIGNDVVARLLGEEFTLFAPKSPLTLEEWEHQQMIAETTCRTRENMRMR